jgi:hypothetical protein
MKGKKRRNTLLPKMSVFRAGRNSIVTVTESTCFLLRAGQKHNPISDFCREGSVTKTPSSERRSRLLRGFGVTVTFPRGVTVTTVAKIGFENGALSHE